MKALIFSLLLLPAGAYAHVKWFTDTGIPADPYKLTDLPVVAWVVASILIIAIFYLLENKLPCPPEPSTKFKKTILTVADIGIGISFLLFSYFGFIFAPNLPASGEIGTLLLIAQAIIGVGFLLGVYTRIAAVGLVVLYVWAAMVYGSYELIDALEILGFGFYGIITGHPRWGLVRSDPLKRLTTKLQIYSVPILRIFIGANLIVLGFTEKILRPDLGLEFLQNYNWNFTEALGFPISDYWFVFSAGVGEILFGVLFILGLVTRSVTLALAGFLITTLVLLGPTELVGHLPHFSLAIVLLTLGAGTRFRLKSRRY